MKKSLQFFIAAVLLAGFTQHVSAQHTYRWRGGTGNWNDATKWSKISAITGAIDPSLPATPSDRDNVIFDNLSFTAANQVVTVNVNAFSGNMTWNGALFNPTLNVNRMLTIAGSLSITNAVRNRDAGTAASNLTIATTAPAADINGGLVGIRFTSTATNSIIKSDGVAYPVPVIFNGVGGRWTLHDNMAINRSAQFLNGHVVALPLPATNPLNPNAGLVNTPTDPQVEVTGSPRFQFAAAATVSGASHASHVVGYVEKSVVSGTAPFEFPIGDGTYYRPLITRPAASGNTLLARYFSAAPAKPISTTEQLVNGVPTTWSRVAFDTRTTVNSVSNREFWYFDAADNSSPGFRINATHPDPAIAEYMRLDRWAGLTIAGLTTDSSKPPTATWSDMNAATGNVVTQSINPVTGVTDFWVSAAGVSNSNNWITFGRRGVTSLPVRLVSFTGQQLDGQVQLKWQSSSEENTSHFDVEKSADGKNFSPVLTKKAQGNSAELVSYNALDNSPLSGTSYYRLKMVDLDGTFEYSKMVAVSAESELLVRAYPNPSKGNSVHLIAGNGSKLVLKSVSDLFGKQVGYQAANAPEGLQVNFAQPLPAGFYVATLAGNDNGQLVKVKFVVQ
jgi:hypothetical protein